MEMEAMKVSVSQIFVVNIVQPKGLLLLNIIT
jgi:hypothetical protein